MLRRYAPIKPSRGTEWPPEVRAEITRLDGGRCVCERAGFPPEVVAKCGGDLQLDHVRASHGVGMKSPSTVENGATLSAWCHRWKTENGKTILPVSSAELPRGAVLGSVRLDGLARTSVAVRWPETTELEIELGDYSPGRYAWVLGDPRSLPEPIPARGALGLWEWSGVA